MHGVSFAGHSRWGHGSPWPKNYDDANDDDGDDDGDGDDVA